MSLNKVSGSKIPFIRCHKVSLGLGIQVCDGFGKGFGSGSSGFLSTTVLIERIDDMDGRPERE